MTVQICSRVQPDLGVRTFLIPGTLIHTSVEKVSYNAAVFIMSARLSCSLEPYEVLGKHYDKASACTLRSGRFLASLSGRPILGY